MEIDFIFKAIGISQKDQLELLIDIFEHEQSIDIYSRLSLAELAA